MHQTKILHISLWDYAYRGWLKAQYKYAQSHKTHQQNTQKYTFLMVKLHVCKYENLLQAQYCSVVISYRPEESRPLLLLSPSTIIKKKSLDTQLKSKVEMYCTVIILDLIQTPVKGGGLSCGWVTTSFCGCSRVLTEAQTISWSISESVNIWSVILSKFLRHKDKKFICFDLNFWGFSYFVSHDYCYWKSLNSGPLTEHNKQVKNFTLGSGKIVISILIIFLHWNEIRVAK